MKVREEYLLTQIFGRGFNTSDTVKYLESDNSEDYFLRLLLRSLMIDDKITEVEIAIITRRFAILKNEPYTLYEVAKELNITEVRARQIEAKAMRKLRHPDRIREVLNTYTTKQDFEKACATNNQIPKDEIEICLKSFE